MATAPSRCELIIDLTISSPESSDVASEAESGSDESVIVTEVMRYVEKDISMLAVFTLFGCLQPKSEMWELLAWCWLVRKVRKMCVGYFHLWNNCCLHFTVVIIFYGMFSDADSDVSGDSDCLSSNSDGEHGEHALERYMWNV